jgi:hypothetical protein
MNGQIEWQNDREEDCFSIIIQRDGNINGILIGDHPIQKKITKFF